MRRLIVAAAIIVLIAVPGCSMKSAVSKLDVQLRSVHVTHMDDKGLDAVVSLYVYNPNWFSLTISDFSYKAFIGGTEVASGATDRRIKIPAGGFADAELPVEVRYGRLKDELPGVLFGGPSYRVTGEVGISTWLGRYAVPFDTVKRLDEEILKKDKKQKKKKKHKNKPAGEGNTI